MPKVTRSALVEFSAEQMFNLVNDIEQYPEFLPGCIESEVSSRTDELVIGTMDLQKGPVRQRFTTRNTLYGKERMDMELADGPLDHLVGQWRFIPIGKAGTQACKVELDLDFEFKSVLVGLALNGLITDLANTMVDAFIKRAKEIYSNE